MEAIDSDGAPLSKVDKYNKYISTLSHLTILRYKQEIDSFKHIVYKKMYRTKCC